MKKTGLLFLLFLLLLCGCGRKGENAEQQNGYQIYYINKDGTKIVGRDYEMQAQDSEGQMRELPRCRRIPGQSMSNGRYRRM